MSKEKIRTELLNSSLSTKIRIWNNKWWTKLIKCTEIIVIISTDTSNVVTLHQVLQAWTFSMCWVYFWLYTLSQSVYTDSNSEKITIKTKQNENRRSKHKMKLITINESFTVDSLLPIRLKCNKFGKKTMQWIDQFNTNWFDKQERFNTNWFNDWIIQYSTIGACFNCHHSEILCDHSDVLNDVLVLYTITASFDHNQVFDIVEMNHQRCFVNVQLNNRHPIDLACKYINLALGWFDEHLVLSRLFKEEIKTLELFLIDWFIII